MQPDQSAVSGNKKKTVLIAALVCGVLAIFVAPVIFFAAMIFMMPLPYQKRTAKAQPEIISVKPATWTETSSSGIPGRRGSTSSSSREVKGYSVEYKFTTADGQSISQTDDKHRESDPASMEQVCYEPANPHNSELQPARKCP